MKLLIVLYITGLVMASNATTFSREVTFSKDVRPIFQKYCASCHFGALNYEASKANKEKIYSKFVRSRQMPPKYVSERPNEAEVALVKQWIETGAKK